MRRATRTTGARRRLRDVRGARRRHAVAVPVEEAHDALDDGDVGVGAGQRRRRPPASPIMKRSRLRPGTTGRVALVAGVEVVGTDLVALHAQAAPAQRRHETEGDRRLALAAARRADDEPRDGHRPGRSRLASALIAPPPAAPARRTPPAGGRSAPGWRGLTRTCSGRPNDVQSRTRQPRASRSRRERPAASPAWMRKKPAVVGSVVQPRSRRPATRRSRSRDEQRDRPRRGASRSASAARPAAWAQALTLQGGAAARSAAASTRRGDRVAQAQAGEAPVLGHRAQDDEVAGVQQTRAPTAARAAGRSRPRRGRRGCPDGRRRGRRSAPRAAPPRSGCSASRASRDAAAARRGRRGGRARRRRSPPRPPRAPAARARAARRRARSRPRTRRRPAPARAPRRRERARAARPAGSARCCRCRRRPAPGRRRAGRPARPSARRRAGPGTRRRRRRRPRRRRPAPPRAATGWS